MSKNEDLLDLARERMCEAIDADRENRGRAMDDLQKLVGQQWPDDIRVEREAAAKPCLTLNRLPQFVRQVTGDIRRMNPAIRVMPSDNAATEDVARIYEGLIRHIEQRSDASTVYEQTAESAAACSIGAFRVRTEWQSEDSFDQEIRIGRIRNALSVYFDPSAEMPTREDADYCFITEVMSQDEFKEAYPKATLIDAKHDGLTDGLENWQEGGTVTVAEYYYKEPVTRLLVLLTDGRTVFADQVDGEIPEEYIVRKRKVETHKVMWAKISGRDVLEGPTEVPCKYIPVVAVTGEEWHVGEEVYRSSVIRFAKDPQQLYNFFRSSAAEIATLQPKAPYIGTLNQFKGLETYWQNANSSNYAYLPYHPDPKAPGAPQRQQPPVSSQAMTQEALAAADDMKATTGIYDAALGQASNETSGVAIRQRQVESDVSTSIYTDNMAKAIEHCGRILLSMIPRVYDTNRVVRIIGEDEQEQRVEVNGLVQSQGGAMAVNDLTIGSYDLRVTVGPNYTTRRQETAEGMLEFIRVVPGAAQVVGDLVAKAMEWPDADKIADRLKKALPPQFRNPEDMTPEEQQQMQAAMQQQQVAAQMAQAREMAGIQKEQAEAVEAGHDAQKAQFEVMNEQLELAAKSGELNAVIGQIVQQEVARALQGATQMGLRPAI